MDKIVRSVLVIVILVALGCGPSGPAMYTVSGRVTLDDQPVEEGEIVFFTVDERLGPDAGKIVHGEFLFKAKAGTKRVEIDASREVPGTEGQGFRDGCLLEDYIPERYNTATTLSAKVTPDGENRFDFELDGD